MRNSKNKVATINTTNNNNHNHNIPYLVQVNPNTNPRQVPQPVERSHGGMAYLTFNVSTYNKREINELKRRFVSELKQVRALRARLDILGSGTRHFSPPRCLNTTHIALSSVVPKQSGGGVKRNGASKQKPKRQVVSEATSTMKQCGSILSKLMSQKRAYIFNTPVDVMGLGLYDYHRIITKPMDLGTVKVNLEAGMYASPMEFAAYVRLVFDNAMLYNPKDHHVHVSAQHMLAKFDRMFSTVCKMLQDDHGKGFGPHGEAPRVEPVEGAVESRGEVGRKPNKREMSDAKKWELGREIEWLPDEEKEQLLEIVSKRASGALAGDGNVFELDFESLDDQMLWELDRFVRSKMRQQGLNHSGPIPSSADILVQNQGSLSKARSPRTGADLNMELRVRSS